VDGNANGRLDVAEGARGVTLIVLNTRGEVITTLATNDRGRASWTTTRLDIETVYVPLLAWSRPLDADGLTAEILLVAPELPAVLP
jgi:hypothetical protein